VCLRVIFFCPSTLLLPRFPRLVRSDVNSLPTPSHNVPTRGVVGAHAGRRMPNWGSVHAQKRSSNASIVRSEVFESRNGRLADGKGSFDFCPTVSGRLLLISVTSPEEWRLDGIKLSPVQAVPSRQVLHHPSPQLSCPVPVDNHPSRLTHRHSSQLPSEHRFWEFWKVTSVHRSPISKWAGVDVRLLLAHWSQPTPSFTTSTAPSELRAASTEQLARTTSQDGAL
jgi:hypothetical protein